MSVEAEEEEYHSSVERVPEEVWKRRTLKQTGEMTKKTKAKGYKGEKRNHQNLSGLKSGVQHLVNTATLWWQPDINVSF